ncbi:MAG: hypothetical protein ACRDWD_02040 [Acidimicrobiia bacterium]
MIRRLAVLGAVCVPMLAAATPAAGDDANPGVERVLVLSLPNVVWDDIRDADLPNLESLFAGSAIADMTARSVVRRSLPGDAYVTLGAGSRALGAEMEDGLAFERGERYGTESADVVYTRRMGQPQDAPVFSVAVPAVEDANDDVPYDPEIGALGDTLADAGIERAVVANADEPRDGGRVVLRREAVLGLAGIAGTVDGGAVGPKLRVDDPAAPYGTRLDQDAVLAAFDEAWEPPAVEAEVVLVEASDLVRADNYAELATSEQGDAFWDESLAATDELVEALLERVDLDTDAVLVVGPYLEPGRRGLTVAALRAPDLEPGLLRSASTRRSGFVTLGDVAPTVLDLLDIEPPSAMEGRTFERGSTGGSYDDRVDFLVTAEKEARFRDTLVTPVGLAVVVIQAGIAIAAAALLTWPLVARRGVRVVELLALASLGVFPATHLAGLASFDSAGPYWAFVLVVGVALGVLSLALGTRNALDPLLIVLGVTLGLLVIDVLLGAPLQFNTALGYSPTAAFRFTGFGNLAFAELACTAILLACLLVTRLGRRVGLPVALGVLLVALLADGMPMWGSDVGGVLAATPAFLIVALMLWGGRIRARAVALAGAATVFAIAAFAVLDRVRPAGAETHLGRLVDRVSEDGWDSFETVVLRKAETSLQTFVDSVWTFMIPVALLFLAFLVWAGPGRLGRLVTRDPELRPALIGVGVAAVLGAALNDSGVAVPGVMLAILNGALVYLVLRTEARAPDP